MSSAGLRRCGRYGERRSERAQRSRWCSGEPHLVHDYNHELPPPDRYDYVFALGVAEYMSDPAGFFRKLTVYGSTLIFTYHPAERWGGAPEHFGWPMLLRTKEVAAALNEMDYIMIMQEEFQPNEVLYVAIPSPIRLD